MLCLVNAASSTWVHFMECGFTYKSVKGHGMIGQLLLDTAYVCMGTLQQVMLLAALALRPRLAK